MKITLVAGSTISPIQDVAPRGRKHFIVRGPDIAGGMVDYRMES
jgi:hypothetical protein